MADDVNLASPAGTVAADDMGGKLYQKVKLGWGADGTWNETADTAGKEIPVKIASSQMASLGQSTPAASVPVVPAYLEYEQVPVSTTAMLGASGAVDDYIEGLICVVATAATSQVQLKDGNGTAFTVLPNNVGGGVGTYYVPLGLKCINATTPGWQVITAAGVTVIATGNFT